MRGVQPYSGPQLEKMPTRQLLAHLNRLHRCEESVAGSDGPPFGARYNPDRFIYFKEDPRWQEQHTSVKRILAGREHVPRSKTTR